MAIDYFNPATGDQDFFNQLNTLVDTVSTLQDLPSGGGATGGGTVVEVQNADTGRVTVEGNLTRYLYRYIHYRFSSDPNGQNLISDVTTFTGATLYINVNNSQSASVENDAAYTISPFSWADGHHIGYRVSGGGTIFFVTQADPIAQPLVEITDAAGTIDLFNVSASGLTGPAGPGGVTAWIESNDGTVFRNNAGPQKTLTANVNIGGTVPTPTDYAGYNYRWTYEGDTVYVDSGRNLLTIEGVPITTPQAGRFAADSTVTTTVGLLRDIFVQNDDVNNQLRLGVEVSNIP